MIYKSRGVPYDLQVLRILNSRMVFSSEIRRNYLNLEKGYEGEVQFDSLTEKLQNECYILNDLLLKMGNTSFQIDTTIIIGGKIKMFEVKNSEGEYCYGEEKLIMRTGKGFVNPAIQLIRSKSLLSQVLQIHGFEYPIEAHVVFPNPNFTLFECPLNVPYIFPSQLKRFMNHLEKIPSQLTKKDKELADKLISLHQSKSPYNNLPEYHFDGCKKGISCSNCRTLKVTPIVGKRSFVCDNCGNDEGFDEAILGCVEELKLLFSDKPITTSLVYDWCGGIVTRKIIRRILKKNFTAKGGNKDRHFE